MTVIRDCKAKKTGHFVKTQKILKYQLACFIYKQICFSLTWYITADSTLSFVIG